MRRGLRALAWLLGALLPGAPAAGEPPAERPAEMPADKPVEKPEEGASEKPPAYKVSKDGRLALIPIDPDNVASVKELLQMVQPTSRGVNVAVYTPVGLLPQLVVSGEPANVEPFVQNLLDMFLETGEKHIVIISASLRELSESDVKNVGLNLLPSSISATGAFTAAIGSSPSGSVALSAQATVLQLDQSTGRGKIMVASEVFTPNGVKANISDVQHVPIFSVDKYGNVQTQFQDLQTSIEVTPTVVRLPAGESAAADVRLDITVQASVITGEARFSGYTAPQYSDKKFTTTRVFPADGNTYVVGSFVTDSLIKSQSGVPFLSTIPLLKYLFSQETVTKQRSYGVLSLAVKVLRAPSTRGLTVEAPLVSSTPAGRRVEPDDLDQFERKVDGPLGPVGKPVDPFPEVPAPTLTTDPEGQPPKGS